MCIIPCTRISGTRIENPGPLSYRTVHQIDRHYSCLLLHEKQDAGNKCCRPQEMQCNINVDPIRSEKPPTIVLSLPNSLSYQSVVVHIPKSQKHRGHQTPNHHAGYHEIERRRKTTRNHCCQEERLGKEEVGRSRNVECCRAALLPEAFWSSETTEVGWGKDVAWVS